MGTVESQTVAAKEPSLVGMAFSWAVNRAATLVPYSGSRAAFVRDKGFVSTELAGRALDRQLIREYLSDDPAERREEVLTRIASMSNRGFNRISEDARMALLAPFISVSNPEGHRGGAEGHRWHYTDWDGKLHLGQVDGSAREGLIRLLNRHESQSYKHTMYRQSKVYIKHPTQRHRSFFLLHAVVEPYQEYLVKVEPSRSRMPRGMTL